MNQQDPPNTSPNQTGQPQTQTIPKPDPIKSGSPQPPTPPKPSPPQITPEPAPTPSMDEPHKSPPDEEKSRKPVGAPVKDVESQTRQKPDIPLDTSKIPYWEETQNLINKLEQLFQQKVITLYVSRGSRITQGEVEELYNHLYKIGKQEKLALFIYGPGGSGIAAYRIVKLLRNFTKELNIIVPSRASSAMTMLALGADKIFVGPLSVFSPIDTSIANHPLAPKDSRTRYPVSVEITQVQKYLELVKKDQYKDSSDFRKTPYYALTEKVHPLFLGTIQRSLSLSKLLLKGIVETHLDNKENVKKLVDRLNDEYPTHSFPILKADLEKFGLNISKMSDEQNFSSQELLNYYDVLSKGTTDVKDNLKTIMRRYVFVESANLRSYVIYLHKSRLTDGKWTKLSSKEYYNRAAVAKNERGYNEVVVLSTKQFRKLIKGQEIVAEKNS
jgi:ClpP class serine protease